MTEELRLTLQIASFESIHEMRPFFAHGKIWIKTDKTGAKELMKDLGFANFTQDPIDSVVVDLTDCDGHGLLPHLIDAQNNKYEDRFYILKHLSEKDKIVMNTCEVLHILGYGYELITENTDKTTTINTKTIESYFKEKIKMIEEQKIKKYNEMVCKSLQDLMTPTEDTELNLFKWCDTLLEASRKTADKFYDLHCKELLI